MKYTLFLITALGLGACGLQTAGSAPAAGGASGPDTCGAAAYQDLIGKDAAASLALPEPKRAYRPDEAVTTDINPARLNVQLDDTDTIVAVTCG